MIDLVCARCSKLVKGQALERPEGWMCVTCAGGAAPRSTAKLAIGLGCGALLIWGLLIMMFLALWQFLSPERPPVAAADAGPPDALTERYASGNGLVIAHYPASFAASKEGDGVLTVQRARPSGDSDAVVLEVVSNPISNDLNENHRLVCAAEAKVFDRYVEIANGPGTCVGRPGVRVAGSFVASNGVRYDRRACRFLEGGRFYTFAYALPESSTVAQRALLEKIVDATELTP
jgi:hypothetical protein